MIFPVSVIGKLSRSSIQGTLYAAIAAAAHSCRASAVSALGWGRTGRGRRSRRVPREATAHRWRSRRPWSRCRARAVRRRPERSASRGRPPGSAAAVTTSPTAIPNSGSRAARRGAGRLPPRRRPPYGVRDTPGNTGYGPSLRPRPATAEVSGRPRTCSGRGRPSGKASSRTSRDVRGRDATGDAAVMGELLAIGARSGLSDRGPFGPDGRRARGRQTLTARQGQARLPSRSRALRVCTYHPASIGTSPKQRSYLLVSPLSSPSVNLHTSCPDRSPPPA